MMNRGIKLLVLSLGMLIAAHAWAMPLPDFILYGDAGGNSSLSAYWNDELIATSELVEGHFKLAIAMDTESAYGSGDVVELWINGQPTGQMESIGDVGTARKIGLD